MDVEQIRKNIKDAYHSFSSYQDSGEIIAQNFDRGLGWFSTSFLRPNQLIFEFSDHSSTSDKTTLMVNGDRFQLLSGGPAEIRAKVKGVEKTEVVMRNNWPMSGLGGVTFGMSDTVLPMLIPNSGRPCFIHEKLALLRDETIDGEPCYHFREIYKPHHIWVSKNDFTIRRSEDYGCIPLSDLVIGYTSAIMGVTSFFSRKKDNVPDDWRKMMTTEADWRFKTVRYNHLDADTFPKFEFKTKATKAGA